MQPKFYNIVNDELRGSENTHQVTDPRTEEELWPCPVATTQDFEDAVEAAQRAFTTWSQTTVAERQAALVKLADIIKENAEELAQILMKETGKSVCHRPDSRGREKHTDPPRRRGFWPMSISKAASPSACTTVSWASPFALSTDG